ncbi:type II toxin-antitoxin system Phd/YefM family antitoxin [Treponema medium]|uniref:Type II toxin-antitoxin system Phd/YefM family antitoxin n=1 Tax=Treponema medium TaxID=58231 RepID=A0ABX7LXU0_TREMD|nr:type II toxin-antitoxin system Phd/YefM family antitoxin [Treponema medium]QSH97196.1 type II toxin-antitoxin system Phd/YefM family antitoxin [Treponema medium]
MNAAAQDVKEGRVTDVDDAVAELKSKYGL